MFYLTYFILLCLNKHIPIYVVNDYIFIYVIYICIFKCKFYLFNNNMFYRFSVFKNFLFYWGFLKVWRTLSWKPLFKKTSYFVFCRNSINNIIYNKISKN